MTTWFHEIRRASSVLQLIKEALQRSEIDVSEFEERCGSSGEASLYLQRAWCIVEVILDTFQVRSSWHTHPGSRPFLENVSVEFRLWFIKYPKCFPINCITITYDATTTRWRLGITEEFSFSKKDDLEPIKTKGPPWEAILPYIENTKKRDALEKTEALSLINAMAQIAAIPRDAKTRASGKNRGKRLRKYLRKRTNSDHGTEQ